MFIRLGIIAAVSVGLLVAFSSEINDHFPNTATSGLDAFKRDVDSMAAKSLESAGQRIDSSSQKIKTQLAEAGDRTLASAGQAFGSAGDRIDSATGKIGEGLAGLTDMSTGLVEQSITEKPESVPGT